jgi:hypothetical protein
MKGSDEPRNEVGMVTARSSIIPYGGQPYDTGEIRGFKRALNKALSENLDHLADSGPASSGAQQEGVAGHRTRRWRLGGFGLRRQK